MDYFKIDQLLEQQINLSLERNLKKLTTKHQKDEAYIYAVIPAGKLFRPKLVWALYLDIDYKNALGVIQSEIKNFESDNVSLLAQSLEIHHSYTLAHDDMPCMDNDSLRRGKPSLHVQYGEWVALLTGDGLLNISYQLLSKISHKNLSEIIKIFSHATGPKGLIHGQLLDLNQDMNQNLETLIRTHELKTARLIQLSLTLPCILLNQDIKTVKKFWRFGKSLGILFQLLDDLQELTENNISIHEKEINPFVKFFERTMPILLKELTKIEMELEQEQFPHLTKIVTHYLNITGNKIFKNQKVVESYLHNGQSINDLKNFKSIFPVE